MTDKPVPVYRTYTIPVPAGAKSTNSAGAYDPDPRATMISKLAPATAPVPAEHPIDVSSVNPVTTGWSYRGPYSNAPAPSTGSGGMSSSGSAGSGGMSSSGTTGRTDITRGEPATRTGNHGQQAFGPEGGPPKRLVDPRFATRRSTGNRDIPA